MSGSCCAVYTSELCVVVLISNVRFCTKMSSCFLVLFALMVLSAFLLFVQLSWSMFLHYSAVVLVGGWDVSFVCAMCCSACLLFYHVAYHYRFCVLASTASLFFFVCGGGVLLCWTSYYIYRRAIWRAACPRGVVGVYCYIRLLLLLWAFWECCRRSVVVVCTMICFLDDCQGVSCLYVLL